MKLSIMQPYIFPYVGYFHLIEATDKIVFYDDVTYIKGGWINRNRILVNGKDSLFTIPLEKTSSFKLINETKLHPSLFPIWRKKFLKTVQQNYSKAPNFKDSYDLIQEVLNTKHDTIADLSIRSLTAIYDYLDKKLDWTKSSICSPTSKGMDKADRIVQISKDLGYEEYINVMGGKELYDKEYFKERGIQLNFVQPDKIEYQQFKNDFIPWLSIIDVVMFTDKKQIKKQFSAYNIV